VIEEICSWLPPGLDGLKVCSQAHIYLITNSFFNDFTFIIQFQHKEYLNSWLYFYIFFLYDWPFLHVRKLNENLLFPV